MVDAAGPIVGDTLDLRRGRFEEGIKSLKFGLRSSPKDLRLTFWSMLLADGLRRAGRHEEALEVATQASRRDGKLYGARVVSAYALLRLNRPDEARTAYERALELTSNRVEGAYIRRRLAALA